MNEPICGWQWLRQHQHDYTQADIDAQTITLTGGGSKLTIPNRKESKGIIKSAVQAGKGEGKL